MLTQRVRIGIVGAGNNTRLRHIPGFRQLPGVDVLGVVNRTPESTARIAKECEIPRTYSDWRALIADPEIDAVMIGTWPNLHCEVTCAALEADKHVLTEARMARTAEEAHRMCEVGAPASRPRQTDRPQPVRSRAGSIRAGLACRRLSGRNP